MICPPCAKAADATTAAVAGGLLDGPAGHDGRVCRDHGRQVRGCGCQHKPVGTAVLSDLQEPATS